MTREITIAYTPDSDDAFYYYALQHELVRLAGVRFKFETGHIIKLNRHATNRQYDVTAISSVVYPPLAADYRILSVGTSVGRGYGPVLVSQFFHTLDELHGKRIAVGGIPTTGGFLAKWSMPNSEFIERQFNQIADAIVAGEFDAGVMIHEELLFFPQKGLHRVVDLGEVWLNRTGLPLPVGLNVISRHLEEPLMQDICDCLRESLHYALTHREEALAWAIKFGRGEEADCGKTHIEMFANADSVMMPQDVRQGLNVLYPLVMNCGIAETIPPLDIIDGSTASRELCMDVLTKSSQAA